MGKHQLEQLFKKLEALTVKQKQHIEYSSEWIELEKQVIITECLIFNKLIRMQDDIDNFAVVLSLISIHLITYIEEDKFVDELKHLTIESKVMMYYVLDHLQSKLKENQEKPESNDQNE